MTLKRKTPQKHVGPALADLATLGITREGTRLLAGALREELTERLKSAAMRFFVESDRVESERARRAAVQHVARLQRLDAIEIQIAAMRYDGGPEVVRLYDAIVGLEDADLSPEVERLEAAMSERERPTEGWAARARAEAERIRRRFKVECPTAQGRQLRSIVQWDKTPWECACGLVHEAKEIWPSWVFDGALVRARGIPHGEIFLLRAFTDNEILIAPQGRHSYVKRRYCLSPTKIEESGVAQLLNDWEPAEPTS